MSIPSRLALLAAALTFSALAHAEPPPAPAHAEARSRVALVRAPPRAGPDETALDREVADATLRLRSELAATDFDVVIVEAGEGIDGSARPFAVVTIAPAPGGAAASISVAVHAGGDSLERRIRVPPGDDDADDEAKALAIHAVELLRATLLEVRASRPGVVLPSDVARWIAGALPPPPTEPKSRAPTPAEPPAPTPTKPHAAPDRPSIHDLSAEAGVAALASFGDVADGISPAIRVGYSAPFGLGGRVSFYGPTLGHDLRSALGSATLHEHLLVLEATYDGGLRHRLFAPLLSLGGGVYHARVQGTTAAGRYFGRTDDLWAAVLDAGVGVVFRPTDRLGLVLDVHAIVEHRRPIVMLGPDEAGRATRPMWLTSLGLLVSP